MLNGVNRVMEYYFADKVRVLASKNVKFILKMTFWQKVKFLKGI